MYKKTTNLLIAILLCLLCSCASKITIVDPLKNEEIDQMVVGAVQKMVNNPRAQKHLATKEEVDVELLPLRNRTRNYMKSEWDAIKSGIEEVFGNYSNVYFYDMANRESGQKSINQMQAKGLVKATDQKEAGEQVGADDNIQVTLTESKISKSKVQYRFIIKWYDRQSQRPYGSTSVYFTKDID